MVGSLRVSFTYIKLGIFVDGARGCLEMNRFRLYSTFVNNYVELKKNRGNPLNWKYMVKTKKAVPI